MRTLRFAIVSVLSLALSHASAGEPGVKAPTTAFAPKAPGTRLPGRDVSGGSVPGSSVPGSSVPGSSVPGSSVPGSSVPGQLPQLPAACKADLTKAREDVEKARARLAEAVKNALVGNAGPALEKAGVSALYAECCFEWAIATGVETGSLGSGAGNGMMAACSARLVASTAKDKTPPKIYGVGDGALLCSQQATTAAEAARLASGMVTAETVKAAAAELRAANEKLTAQLRACASAATPAGQATPTAPAPPVLKGLGESCGSPLDCQSAACIEGKCRVVAVPPNGSCDENHLCGPLLECREAKCRLPCACVSPCFVEDGACKKHSMATRTVPKDCPVPISPQGKCIPGCYAVGSACKTDTSELYDQKPMCSPVCP